MDIEKKILSFFNSKYAASILVVILIGAMYLLYKEVRVINPEVFYGSCS